MIEIENLKFNNDKEREVYQMIIIKYGVQFYS